MGVEFMSDVFIIGRPENHIHLFNALYYFCKLKSEK
jgi:hypothetical protein